MQAGGTKQAGWRELLAAAVALFVLSTLRRNLPRGSPAGAALTGVETVPCGTANVTLTVQQPASPYCGMADRAPAGTPPSWCVPTAPWYYLDNGGNACVCEQKWDHGLYASKLWLGSARNHPQAVLAANLYVFLQSAERVFLVLALHEAIEEVLVWWAPSAQGDNGARALASRVDQESRYSSLLRDTLLAGGAGAAVGAGSVWISGAVPFMAGRWPQHVATVLVCLTTAELGRFHSRDGVVRHVNSANFALLAAYAPMLGLVWRVCGRHQPPTLFAWWFAAVAALLGPTAVSDDRSLRSVYLSAACVVALIAVARGCALALRARHAALHQPTPATCPQSDADDIALQADVDENGQLTESAAPCERCRALAAREDTRGARDAYYAFAALLVAAVVAGVAANDFYVDPLSGDAVAETEGWCGMGTVADTRPPAHGGTAACRVLEALVGVSTH